MLQRDKQGRTVLARSRHEGPLCVQRPFYPEADGRAHVYLLHPPGGVVGGDALEVEVEVRSGARALLTTPAATKFYRSSGSWGRQTHTLYAGAGATLEWLPQETILFEAARAEIVTRVELAPDARFAGWEILCLGRTASGEGFGKGSLDQTFELWRAGVPLLIERYHLRDGDPLLRANSGLAGQPVVGCFALVLGSRRAESDALVEAVRATASGLHEDEVFSVTALREVLVCRYLGPRTASARRCFERAWSVLRPALIGAEVRAPRIWAT